MISLATKTLKEMDDQELDAHIMQLREDLVTETELLEFENTTEIDEAALILALEEAAKTKEAKQPGVKKGAPKSPPKGYPSSKGKYADPTNFKYPLDTEKHVRAALGYLSRHGGAYSPEERKFMWRRITSAARKYGITLSPEVKKRAEMVGPPDEGGEIMQDKDLEKLKETMTPEAFANFTEALAKIKEGNPVIVAPGSSSSSSDDDGSSEESSPEPPGKKDGEGGEAVAPTADELRQALSDIEAFKAKFEAMEKDAKEFKTAMAEMKTKEKDREQKLKEMQASVAARGIVATEADSTYGASVPGAGGDDRTLEEIMADERSAET